MTILFPIRNTKVLPVYTWATLPTTQLDDGFSVILSDYDFAEAYYYQGSWYLYEFQQLAHSAPIIKPTFTGLGEQTIYSKKIDKGIFKLGDVLSMVTLTSKSAAVETQTFRLRFGKNNSTADALILTVANTVAVQTNIGNVHFGISRISDTSVRLLFASFMPIDIVTDNMAINDMYLSMTVQLSVGAEVVSLEQGQIVIY